MLNNQRFHVRKYKILMNLAENKGVQIDFRS